MRILALNGGSSSLKFGLFEDGACEGLLADEIDWAHGDRARAQLIVRPRHGRIETSCVAAPDDFAAARLAVKTVLDFGLCGPDGSAGVAGVGHRVVHGGAEVQDSVLIDSKVKAGIAGLSKLAPLHNPAVKGANWLPCTTRLS